MWNKSDGKYGCYSSFCPFSFGVAVGVVSGLCMALFAWIAAMWGYGYSMVEQYGAIYYGYAPTFVGGVMGGVWGLVEGFIIGFLIAGIYNCILRCSKRSSSSSCGCGPSADKMDYRK